MVGLFRYPKRRLRKLVQQGEYKEALEFGASIEEKFSNDPDFFFIMGSIYYILEDAKNTLYYFNKSLEINENDIETLLLKANVHLHLKELNSVIDGLFSSFNLTFDKFLIYGSGVTKCLSSKFPKKIHDR